MTRRRVITPSRVDASVSNADGAGVDSFGRVRTSEPTNRFDVEFTHDLQSFLMDSIVAGGGTVAFDSTNRDAKLKVNGTGATAAATLGGHYHVPYTPGNSQLIDITGTLDAANLGGTVSVVLRNGGVETVTEEADWKRADLVSDVDWAKSQILTIDFQSLKVGRIRLGLVRDGLPVHFHWIENDNRRVHGYWQYPSLAPFWKIYNTATNTVAEMGYGDTQNGIFVRFTAPLSASGELVAICATVKSEGGAGVFDLPGFRSAASNGVVSKTVGASLIPVLSVRVKTTLNGVPNVGIHFLDGLEFSTDNAIYWELRINPTLTGAAFASLDTTSGLEADTTASAVTGGRVLASGYAGAGGTRVAADRVGAQGRAPLSCDFSGTTGDVLTVCARRLSLSASVGAAVSLREIR